MICWVKLIWGMLVWKKRTVIASPSFNSPTRNSRMACDQARSSAKCWQSRIRHLKMHSSAALIYMSQIHAHRFGLGDSIGSVCPSNGQVQNLYNRVPLRL